jgi:hypothetical protein
MYLFHISTASALVAEKSFITRATYSSPTLPRGTDLLEEEDEDCSEQQRGKNNE